MLRVLWYSIFMPKTEKPTAKVKPPVVKKKKKRISWKVKKAAEIAALKIKFLEYYRTVPVQKLAANFISRSEDTITDWKKADTHFSDQIEVMGSEWAKEKVSEVKSPEWLLERLMNDHFRNKSKVELDVSEEVEKALDFIRTKLPKAGQ